MTDQITTLETALLSQILVNPELYKGNIHIFSDQTFMAGTSRYKIYQAFTRQISEGETPDFVSISTESNVSIDEVMDIYNAVDFRFEFKNTLQKVVEYRLKLRLIEFCNSVITNLTNSDNVFTQITKLREFIDDNELQPIKRISTISENIDHLITAINSRIEGEITGLRTGLKKLDDHTGGLQPSDLFVIAGETSQGKTSLALTIAYNAAINHSGRIAVFSLEMSAQQLTARLTSMETGISSKKILFYPLHQYDKDKIKLMQYLPASGIFIDDCSNSSIDYIISGIRIAHMQYKIQVAVVDYLQLIKDQSKRNEETEISSNARRLKNLAKELGITIILLSQLARDKGNPKPTISRLRGSGQIEEAADIVGLIWRPETYGISTYDDDVLPNTFNSAELIIAKGRNYGITRMYMAYDPRLTYFSNLDYDNTGKNLPY